MNAATFGIMASCLYLMSATFQWRDLVGKKTINRSSIILLGIIAIIAHSASALSMVAAENGYQFSLFRAGSLISLVVTLIVVLSSLKKPIENLFIGLFPLAACAIMASLFINGDSEGIVVNDKALLAHILLSVAAYSVILIAVCQALLLYLQNYQLKHKHTVGIIKALPPLQTMESLLFEMILAGMILLSAAIISGFIFLEDIFAQHLVHKTFFSIISWIIFGVLLVGRHTLGWRGATAIKWTLSGGILLMLAYFGSKFVLEFIVN